MVLPLGTGACFFCSIIKPISKHASQKRRKPNGNGKSPYHRTSAAENNDNVVSGTERDKYDEKQYRVKTIITRSSGQNGRNNVVLRKCTILRPLYVDFRSLITALS